MDNTNPTAATGLVAKWLKTKSTSALPFTYVVTGNAEQIAQYVADKEAEGYARYLQAPYNKDAEISPTPSPYPVIYAGEDCGQSAKISWIDEKDARYSGYKVICPAEQKEVNRLKDKAIRDLMRSALAKKAFSVLEETESFSAPETTTANLNAAPAVKPTSTRGSRKLS